MMIILYLLTKVDADADLIAATNAAADNDAKDVAISAVWGDGWLM